MLQREIAVTHTGSFMANDPDITVATHGFAVRHMRRSPVDLPTAHLMERRHQTEAGRVLQTTTAVRTPWYGRSYVGSAIERHTCATKN